MNEKDFIKKHNLLLDTLKEWKDKFKWISNNDLYILCIGRTLKVRDYKSSIKNANNHFLNEESIVEYKKLLLINR